MFSYQAKMFFPEKRTVIEEKKSTIQKIERADAKKIPTQWEMIGTGPINLIANSVPEYKDVVHLTETCRFLFHTTKPAFDERKLAQLAHYILVDPSKVNITNVMITRLAAEPMLVSYKIKQSKDIVGRIIKNKTLFQLAYGAGDDELCQVMKSVFIKHLGSEKAAIEEMERQCHEMLESEEDYKNQEEKSKAHFDALLQSIIKAIGAEQFNLGRDFNKKLILSSATLEAINTFKEEFAKSQPMVIDKGLHFRYRTLQETLYAYVRSAADWHDNDNKCVLFQESVVATVLSYLPANDAMKLSQGLSHYYLPNEPEQRCRSLTLRESGKNFYEVCRQSSSDFALLFSSGVDIIGGRNHVRFVIWEGGPVVIWFREFRKTKISNLQSLCTQPGHSPTLGA